MTGKRVTAKMRHQWRLLNGVPSRRIAELWDVHRDTVHFHLWDKLAEHRRQQWRDYKHRHIKQEGEQS